MCLPTPLFSYGESAAAISGRGGAMAVCRFNQSENRFAVQFQKPECFAACGLTASQVNAHVNAPLCLNMQVVQELQRAILADAIGLECD